jgi:hypothetical protein
MNNLSCQWGILDFDAGRSDLLGKKKDVLITSNFNPRERQAANAFGTFGLSM